MYLVVDGQALQGPAGTTDGVGRHARNLIGGLRQVAPGWRIELVQSAALAPIGSTEAVAVATFHPPLPVEPGNAEVNERYYADWLASRNPDGILVLDSFDARGVVPRFTHPRPPLFGILYDLIPLLFSAQYLAGAESRRLYTRRLRQILDADCVFATSRSTAEDLRRVVPGRIPEIVTIGSAPDRAALSAALACEAIGRLAGQGRGPASVVRRIAWVSPAPPALSAIADYSAELLPHLAREFEIDVIVDPAQPPVDPGFAARHRVVTADEVLERHVARPYDLFVHHVGNSSFHSYMLPLMLRCPGLLVLHDYHLAWLVVHAAVTGNWPTDLATELETEGEEALARDLRAGRVGPWDILETTPLNGRLLGAAEAVLVHSRWAWQRVRAKVGVPVLRVPHPVLVSPVGPRAAERIRLELPAERFIVCTLGLVGPTKRIPSLLRGIAALPASVRARTLLCVVGDIVDGSATGLHELAGSLGIGELVRFVGHVPLHDLAAYGRAADVCVQLRYPTHGETSSALVRALATGTPCIVSDHGSMGEWPETIVVKVRSPEHEVEDLARALAWLSGDPTSRRSVGESAAEYVTAQHDIRHTVARFAATIDLAIARRQATDAAWCESASSALAASPGGTAATNLIEGWARLRATFDRRRGGLAGG